MFAAPRWDTEDGTAKVQRALSAFRQGRPVVVTDDVGRENEGDIFIPAGSISEACMSFLLAHTSGITCVAMSGDRLDELALPAMVPENANDEAMRTAFCVSVDARHGVTTGVSAADRAATVRALGRSGTTAEDLVRPGHIFPLRARPNGVLERRGHTEAAYDLARMAGITPAIVLSELMNRDGTMMRARAIRRFCDEHSLPIVSVEEIACWRRRHPRVSERASAEVQCNGGPARIVAFESESGYVHAALIIGQPMKRHARPPLVRIHSECMTGDTLGSVRCDCGEQLRRSLQRIREDGHGILIYLRGQEGRGIGLVAKLRAYALQNSGLDTVDANTALGLPVDGRAYADAASILQAMGIGSIRLLTNNPDKVRQLRESDVVVEKVIPLTTPTNPFNIRYLVTKRDRMGHGLGDLAEISVPLG